MVAPLDGTTHEHQVGAKIVRDADLVCELVQSVRFIDQTLIGILKVMRMPVAKALVEQQWRALMSTQVSAAQLDIPSTSYHSCYCWSLIRMASYMIARKSAREAHQTLVYVQAGDQAKPIVRDTNTAR